MDNDHPINDSYDFEFAGELAEFGSRKGNRIFWLSKEQREIAESCQKEHGCGKPRVGSNGLFVWESMQSFIFTGLSVAVECDKCCKPLSLGLMRGFEKTAHERGKLLNLTNLLDNICLQFTKKQNRADDNFSRKDLCVTDSDMELLLKRYYQDLREDKVLEEEMLQESGALYQLAEEMINVKSSTIFVVTTKQAQVAEEWRGRHKCKNLSRYSTKGQGADSIFCI